jgi:signal transduction histidine kinase
MQEYAARRRRAAAAAAARKSNPELDRTLDRMAEIARENNGPKKETMTDLTPTELDLLLYAKSWEDR